MKRPREITRRAVSGNTAESGYCDVPGMHAYRVQLLRRTRRQRTTILKCSSSLLFKREAAAQEKLARLHAVFTFHSLQQEAAI